MKGKRFGAGVLGGLLLGLAIIASTGLTSPALFGSFGAANIDKSLPGSNTADTTAPATSSTAVVVYTVSKTTNGTLGPPVLSSWNGTSTTETFASTTNDQHASNAADAAPLI